MFQRALANYFKYLNVEIMIDDILIWGRNVEEHNSKLKDRCRKIGLQLNPDKLEVGKSELVFGGHLTRITSNGVKPDPDKVGAVVEMKPPVKVKGVLRILGMVNYLGKFVPNLSEITEPLRLLGRKGIAFHWHQEQEEAFDKIKGLISESPVL